MNLIAALGYVLGVLIFAYIIRRKRGTMINDRVNKLMTKQRKLEKEKQND
ncbi:MAG: hypothetical protein K9N38_12450 [Candidatus Marinimicrobia bacterium]|nr:hypothetical protein [Candidatus Neomarinimicrobiota bacterium]